MTETGDSGRDAEGEYCHTCGGYHTEQDYDLCPDHRYQEAYREGYQEGFEAGVRHYVGYHFGARLPAA